MIRLWRLRTTACRGNDQRGLGALGFDGTAGVRRCELVREDQQGSAAGAGAPVPASNHPGDGAAHSAVPPRHSEQLRDIQSITDAALSALDPQALLEVLVHRVKEALQADTAAILLLDRPSRQLVATAASGLEEEVQQGVRIPVGKGFAGRIAAQGRPVVLDEVDHTKVVNPILLEKGIRSLMGAPLLAGGKVHRRAARGHAEPRAFTSETWICSSWPPTGPRWRPGADRPAGPRGRHGAAAQPAALRAARGRRAGDGRALRSRHREGGRRLV